MCGNPTSRCWVALHLESLPFLTSRIGIDVSLVRCSVLAAVAPLARLAQPRNAHAHKQRRAGTGLHARGGVTAPEDRRGRSWPSLRRADAEPHRHEPRAAPIVAGRSGSAIEPLQPRCSHASLSTARNASVSVTGQDIADIHCVERARFRPIAPCYGTEMRSRATPAGARSPERPARRRGTEFISAGILIITNLKWGIKWRIMARPSRASCDENRGSDRFTASRA